MSKVVRNVVSGAVLDNIPRGWFEQVEAGTEFVTLIDAHDRVIYVNHAPVPSTDYAGQSVFSFVDVESHDALRTAVTEARATGLPQHFESRSTGLDRGTSLYSNWVTSSTGDPVDGLVAFVAADITERGRIEAELELSELTLRSLIQHSPDVILIVDRDRRIVFVNRSDYGLEMVEILGQPVESFVPEADRQTVIDAVDQVLSTGEPYTYTTGFTAPEGEHNFTTRVVPIADAEGINRVMLVATNTTEQLAAEREKEELEAALIQAQKMESLGQLTGGVAHDFNNILVAISGNLELAQLCDDDPGKRNRVIVSALDACRHATVLTERLLAFSRKQALRPRPIDAGALVAGMEELLIPTLGETVQVTIESDPGLRVCTADPARLESAVLNLAVNARDAMPAGGEVRIRTRNVSVLEGDDVEVPPGEYVLLEVDDDGSGMTPDIAAQAFEPFFTTKAVGLGTGLGLSMVYGFVLQSGGRLQLRTEPGSGTTVQIYLPQTIEHVVEPTRARTPGSAKRGDNELILVVEDNEMVRSLAVDLLLHLGYRAIAADQADAAVEMLQTEPDISLMITDLVLPGSMDGLALAGHARTIRAGLRVLLVSGYPQDVLAGREVDDVRDELLMKPYSTQQFAEAVHRQLVEAPLGSGPDPV